MNFYFVIGLLMSIYLKYLTTQSLNVNVYIIDTPIDTDHRIFSGRTIYTSGGVNSCKDHGTHIAGLIVGVTKNVVLHSIGIIDCNNKALVEDLIHSINWVVDNHQKPAIINLSLVPDDSLVFEDLDAAIKKAIDSGIIVVASAGNSGINRCKFSPATANGIILVGSISRSGVRSSFSNYGDCVTVYAMGEMVTSSIGNNMYAEMTGTSQSAPRITGLIAQYISKNEKITTTQNEVKQFLETISIDKKVIY